MGKHSIPGPDPDPDQAPDEPEQPPAPNTPPQPYRVPFERSSAGDDALEDALYDEADDPDDELDVERNDRGIDPSAAPPPTPPAPSDESQAESQGSRFADGAWQGGHRSKVGRRRGVSIGVIIALITVVVVVAGFIVWRFFGGVLSDRSIATGGCVGSDEPVGVVADPSIAGALGDLADRFNRSGPRIGDRCVKIGVTPADSSAVIAGLLGNWPSELGPRPALWIPASSISTSRLRAAAGTNTISDNRSLVSSPVLLAIKPQLKAALAEQNWATLPGLQTNPVALDAKNMPGWGSLRLALPISGAADATYLAAEAVAAASVPAGVPASAGVGAVNALIGAAPKLPDDSLSATMDALLAGGDPAVAAVHAVVTTEQQLYARAAKVPDAKNLLSSFLPPGPTALADYPAAVLSGNWLSGEQTTAASAFTKFLREPDQLSELAKAGFRTDSGKLPASDVVSFGSLSPTLSIGDEPTRATLADAVTAPASGSAITIMLDQSMPGEEGGKTRLANVVAALRSKLGELAPATVIGLWTFDGVEGRTEVVAGPLSDPVNGKPRSAALTTALDKQVASDGGSVSFTTFRMIYDSALANFRPGMKNSVLVITTGPHTDQSMNGQDLQDYVRKTFDASRPVAIDVIDFGSDADRGSWEAIARLSGGNYQTLGSSNSPELTAAVGNFLR